MDNTAPESTEHMLINAVSEALEMDPNTLSIDTDLLATGRMDSLAIMAIMAFMEDRLGIVLPMEQVVPENFRSIRSLLGITTEARQGH